MAQRRLAAIMFTDMTGYRALAQRNEALADAKAAPAEQNTRDKLEASFMGGRYLGVLVICSRREEALAFLRQWLARPISTSPRELRSDPFCSRLTDDPQFEEILNSAKPL